MTEKRTRQAVTKQKSAEIDARLGQLCATAASAREIGAPAASASDMTAQLNEEFGLDWVEHTYWRRARKAGHDWPGGTVRRLTAEEGQQVDQLLRELLPAGMPGTEVIETINRKMGLDCRFQTYFQRAGRLGLLWVDTPKAGRHLRPVEYLPEAERDAYYNDPAYEARNKIADHVVCRACYAILRDGAMDGKKGHLWLIHRKDLGCDDPKKVLKCYRLLHPGAPLFTFERIAKQQGGDVLELMAKKEEEYATPELLAVARSDPEYEEKYMREYAICRKLRCGFKSRNWLTKHLANAHDIHGKEAVKEYRRQHGWAPVVAPEAAKKKAKELGERNNELRKLAEIGRQHGPDPRDTLAACLRRQGLEPYDMKDELFFDLCHSDPKRQREARKARTYQQLRRHAKEIEHEYQRLGSLSETDLLSVAKMAKSQIKAIKAAA